MNEGKGYLGINQNDMVELGQQVTQLRLVGLEELTPHRHIEEQIADLDIRSHRTTARLLAPHIRAVYLDERTRFIFRTAGGHLHLRHGANRGQCLSPEAHRTKREKVLRFAYLTGGMPLERQAGVHLAHADTVVYHLKQRPSGIAHNYLNTGSTRIKAILHQLFQTGSRALNDLARCDLVGDAVR